MKPDKAKSRRSRQSIKHRLYVYMSLFILLILAILWLFQIVFLNDFYKAIKINQVKAAAASIDSGSSSDSLVELVAELAQSNDFCVSIINSEGISVLDVDVSPGCIIHHTSAATKAELYRAAQEAGGEYLKNISLADFLGATKLNKPKPQGLNETIIYARILKGDNPRYAVLLNAEISPVTATISTLRTQLRWITLIMVIFALGFSILISSRISKPLSDINTSAKELAAGNYSVTFPAGGYREVAELADQLTYAASELSKVEGLRRELIANVSHDLRTPLTMIAGYSELMRDIPGENTPENVQVIIDEAHRLTALVNDMLDISKLQAGVQTLSISRFSVTQLLRETLARYSKLAEQNHFQIEFIADAEVEVSADELKLSQVIYNFVNNAINYTGESKRITVRQLVEDSGRVVRIEVSDYGEGIDKKLLPYIWERYYKIDKNHARAVVGSGLGLSIVKSILELHHAPYGVKSTVGLGSTFWFELDIARTEEDS